MNILNIILLIILAIIELIPYIVIIITLLYGIVILLQIIMKHFNKKNVGTQTDKMSISFITN